jgi:ABC-type multidrug transport system ATPase subunit
MTGLRGGRSRDSLCVAFSLTRRFGDFTAVDSADLTVEGGELVGLVGANGAGKTTLIRMLLGLLQPSEGSATLFGEPPSIATRRRIGYVPQGLGLYEDLTVAENLSFADGAFGADAKVHLDKELVQVEDMLVRDLPLGLRRRVAFSMTLGHRPDLLILDEPTSGVGPLERARLWDGIHAAAEGGAGILVTTHYMSEAEQCDRVLVMAGGRIVAGGTIDEVVGASSVVTVETARWDAALRALDDLGFLVTLAGKSLRVAQASREEVRRALDRNRLQATVDEAGATFEEAFVALAGRGGRA